MLFYTSEQYLAAGDGQTARIHRRILAGKSARSIAFAFCSRGLTDRLHNAGSAGQSDTLIGGGATTSIIDALQATLATNYNQVDTNIIGDISKNVMVRGGYRYVWGNGDNAVLPAEGLLTVQKESIRQQIGMGAVTWRTSQKFSLTGEAEIGSSGGAYFRTSLYNYRKTRALGRYQLTNSLHLSGTYNLISNSNPNDGAGYKFLVHQESAQIAWTPTGKKYDFEGSYEHCAYHSQISYLVPQTLGSAEIDLHRVLPHDIRLLQRHL